MKRDKDMGDLGKMLDVIEDEIENHRGTNPDFDEEQIRTDLAEALIDVFIPNEKIKILMTPSS